MEAGFSVCTNSSDDKATRRKPYLAYNVLFLMMLVAFCSAVQIPFFGYVAGRQDWNSPILYFSLAAIALVVGTAFLAVGIKVFKVKINWFLIVLFSAMALGGVIGSLAHGSILVNSYGEYSIAIDDSNWLIRIESAVNGLLVSYGLFLVYALGPSTRKARSSGFIIAEIFILFCIVAVLFSVFAQWEQYKIALEKGFSRASITSFMGQKNVYAGYLLIGLFAEMVLLELDQRRFRYLMMGFFVAAILFTASKAAIVIAPVAVIAYWVYRFIRLKKEKRFEWKEIVFPSLVVGIAIIGIAIIANLKPAFFASIYISFTKFFQETDASNVTIRLEIWKSGYELTARSPISFIFGHGDVIYSYLLTPVFKMAYMGTSHNFLVEIFGRGGLLRVLVLLGLIGYLGRSYFCRIKKNGKGLFVPLMAMALMLFRECIEYTFLLDMTTSTVAFYCIVILPPIAEGEAEGQNAITMAKHPLDSFVAMRFLTSVILAFAASLVALFIPSIYGWIVPLSVSLVALVFWMITHQLKPQLFRLEDFAALLLAMACLSPLTIAEPSPMSIMAIVLGPGLMALALQACFAAFRDNRGTNYLECSYSNFLYKMDSALENTKR